MSSTLIILGAILQGIGLLMVFVLILSVRAANWIAAGVQYAPVVQQALSGSLGFAGELRTKKCRTPLGDDATPAERIDWLERSLKYLDDDVDQLRGLLDQQSKTVVATARELDDAVRKEIATTEARWAAEKRRSLIETAIAAAFIASGLTLGTIGSVS
jgi:hypothetical protein